MENLDLNRLVNLDHEWKEIEESYRLEPYHAPVNLAQEKEAMLSAFKAGKSYNPRFVYNNPPEFPVENIYRFIQALHPENSALERMYYVVAQNELLAIQAVLTHSPSIITGYTSLVYGLPDNELIEAARSILASNSNQPHSNDGFDNLSAEEAAVQMQSALKKLGLDHWNAQPFSPMNAKVSVNRKDKLIKIRENATFSQLDLRRLVVHEIGVHVIRGENGTKQPMGIFSRGLPSYLATEEGLAVYSEEKAGVIETTTLRKYAGRVVAATIALSHSFNDTFCEIASDVEPDTAFEIVARAKRGFRDTSQPGAHTKDIVYLKGYQNVSRHLAEYPEDYQLLFVGKIGLADISIVRELFESGVLSGPALSPMV